MQLLQLHILVIYDISIHIIVLFTQLWVSQHVIVAYTNNTSRMFTHSLV